MSQEHEGSNFGFNQSVDNLPHNITHLAFGCEFNQSVDNLPGSLIQLTILFILILFSSIIITYMITSNT